MTVSSQTKGFYLSESDFKPQILENALYIVATPIGNLQDITLRALQVLGGVDFIACEDTRVTGKLLKRFAIKTRFISYHDHNAEKQGRQIVEILENGASIALVSDAGTPLISDPGYRLVNDVLGAGYKVIPIPGASSPINALCASGLASDSFLFAGFLPAKKQARKTRLEELASLPTTLIFLESPNRLLDTLSDCAAILGGTRKAVIAREMTKLYETFTRGTLVDLAENLDTLDTLKGEIVLLIEAGETQVLEGEALNQMILKLLKDHRIKEVAEILSKQTGHPKRILYQKALQLKETLDESQ